MTLTRDQLRAARMLLRLDQDRLSDLSGVAIASIKRFEIGMGIRPKTAAVLRATLETAGVVLIDGGELPRITTGPGVVLRPDDELPESTKAWIEGQDRASSEKIEDVRLRRKENRARPGPKGKPGRPRKDRTRDVDGPEARGDVAGGRAHEEGVGKG